MGAPPGWGPNWKKNQEKERYADAQREAEKVQHKALKEKRDLDILRNGDLVKNSLSKETGVIVEAGYRSHVEVLTSGVPRKWFREHVEVIQRNSDDLEKQSTQEI
jgi:hypothetical protein